MRPGSLIAECRRHFDFHRILPSVHVPTLVFANADGEGLFAPENARYVASARIGAKAGPSEVLASQTVKDIRAGSGLVFADRGEHELKGVPDRWRLYAVTG